MRPTQNLTLKILKKQMFIDLIIYQTLLSACQELAHLILRITL